MSEKVLNGARAAEFWEAVKGRSLPTKSVTQAEYDALSEEEKKADVLYIVDEPPWIPVPMSIQEYDTDDGWHVRKWSDGYVDMAKKASMSFAQWNPFVADRSIFYSPTYYSSPFPLILHEKYSETLTILSTPGKGSQQIWGETIINSSPANPLSESNSYVFLSYIDRIYQNADFVLYVIGLWK